MAFRVGEVVEMARPVGDDDEAVRRLADYRRAEQESVESAQELLTLLTGSTIRVGIGLRIGIDILPLAEAARLIGQSPETLHTQRRRGRLTAQKIGREWWVQLDDLERYLNSRQRRVLADEE